MGCCGGKRAQLRRALADRAAEPSPDGADSLPQPIRERRNRTFEYVGTGSLTLRGSVTGRSYRFVRRGERVEVDHDDTFAMMAERDLSPVKQPDT